MTSDYYNRYWSDQGFAPTGVLTPNTQRALERLVPYASRVVDVGCGDGGAVGEWALAHGHDYRGCDIALGALERARARGLRAELIGEDGTLPFHDDAADVVTCLEVLEHVFDPEATLREVHRILRPSGLILVSVPNAAYWVRRVELGLVGRFNPYGDHHSVTEPWRDPHLRFFTRGSLMSLLRHTGFGHLSLEGDVHSVFSLRTRIENAPTYRWIASRWPALLAPTLLATGREMTHV